MAHIPVLLQEVIEGLDLHEGEVVVDCTLNNAGHSLPILEKTGGKITLIGIDADPSAIERSEKLIADKGFKAILVNENFRNLDIVLKNAGIEMADKFLFDLGWSSDQLESGRGFSFKNDEPLNMTYGKSGKEVSFTAEEIVNGWDEENLSAIIWGYGEERYSRRIARAIVASREVKPIKTTGDLVQIILSATPGHYHHGRIHPATRTFQALRIAVNDEILALEEGIRKAFEATRSQGRIAIITFHSIEDRIVKRFFKAKELDEKGKIITKKPIVPSEEEISDNPRARSSKLRIFEKK